MTTPPTTHRDGFTHTGFTLIELLIVSVLLSVLMVGVWAMLRNWSGLYERGERLTQEAQLTRSLCDQLTDDLQAVTFRPAARRRGRGARRSRRRSSNGTGVALVGEKDWMVLDVLQSVNPYREMASSSESDPLEENQMLIRSPELQRVIYRFQSRADTTEAELDEASPTFFGLVRLAVAQEYLAHLATLDSASGGVTRRRSTLKDAVAQVCGMATNPEEVDLAAAEQTDVASDATAAEMGRPAWLPGVIEQAQMPEIGWLEFRYFDGTGWLDRWDSQAEGRLPVAVEIRFEIIELPSEDELELTEEEKAEKLLEAETEEQTSDAAMLEGEEPAWAGQTDPQDSSGLLGDEPPPYHRVVVYLQPPKEWPAEPEQLDSSAVEEEPIGG